MDKIYPLIFFLIILFATMAVYLRLASRYNIIDKPNQRSSHNTITIRGGGIIIPLAILLYTFAYKIEYPFFLTGLLLVSIISFADDILTINGKVRMAVHFVAIALIFIEIGTKTSFYFAIPLAIFAVATINAWNFMDGINGLNGGYSLIVILSLLYLNENVIKFASTGIMVATILALIVFIYYNFRIKARCFAGDVGSVSVAFIIVFLIASFITATGNINCLLFILIYGLDAATTVFFRAIKKENILEPHRQHVYQYLANEKKISHIKVSMLYIAIQAIINALVIYFAPSGTGTFFILLGVSAVIFLAIRFLLEGREKLLGRNHS